MKQESHIQWVFYDVDHYDYYVSLNKETLENIRNWNIIKSKIVYLSDKDITQNVQKRLLITLLSEDERNLILRDTRIVHNQEEVWLKISGRLLDILIEENLEDYEHRYDFVWNKIHFLTKNSKNPFNDKSWFDRVFSMCEKSNRVQPTTWDLFESEYINVIK